MLDCRLVEVTAANTPREPACGLNGGQNAAADESAHGVVSKNSNGAEGRILEDLLDTRGE